MANLQLNKIHIQQGEKSRKTGPVNDSIILLVTNNIYIINYVSPWSTLVPEKPTGPEKVKFLAFY